jgi:hypothetical protein
VPRVDDQDPVNFLGISRFGDHDPVTFRGMNRFGDQDPVTFRRVTRFGGQDRVGFHAVSRFGDHDPCLDVSSAEIRAEHEVAADARVFHPHSILFACHPGRCRTPQNHRPELSAP